MTRWAHTFQFREIRLQLLTPERQTSWYPEWLHFGQNCFFQVKTSWVFSDWAPFPFKTPAWILITSSCGFRSALCIRANVDNKMNGKDGTVFFATKVLADSHVKSILTQMAVPWFLGLWVNCFYGLSGLPMLLRSSAQIKAPCEPPTLNPVRARNNTKWWLRMCTLSSHWHKIKDNNPCLLRE